MSLQMAVSECGAGDDDDGGWLTPENIAQFKADTGDTATFSFEEEEDNDQDLLEDEQPHAACMTGDFSMQVRGAKAKGLTLIDFFLDVLSISVVPC